MIYAKYLLNIPFNLGGSEFEGINGRARLPSPDRALLGRDSRLPCATAAPSRAATDNDTETPREPPGQADEWLSQERREIKGSWISSFINSGVEREGKMVSVYIPDGFCSEATEAFRGLSLKEVSMGIIFFDADVVDADDLN